MTGLSIDDRLEVSPEVAAALAEGRPVVALESTLISHGLPFPLNLEVATSSEAAVRGTGAVPATVAIHAGRFLVGLDEAALLALATAPEGSVRKAARPSLAAALEDGGWAATTVSATMIAAHAVGISVFATGGIGGVHRGALGRPGAAGAAGARAAGIVSGAPPTLDISSDLEELGRTPVAVVCAGPKAILDVPATLEYLETRGVPVIAVGQAELPGFYARSSGIAAPDSVPDVLSAARFVGTHLGLGLGGGILVCVPVPAADALADDVARAAVERAVAEADQAGVAGPALTPWLLARIAVLTEGASLRANTALIVNDARVAGELAVRLAQG
jgi:pseudouridine-5'-phosphate glycosidase